MNIIMSLISNSRDKCLKEIFDALSNLKIASYFIPEGLMIRFMRSNWTQYHKQVMIIIPQNLNQTRYIELAIINGYCIERNDSLGYNTKLCLSNNSNGWVGKIIKSKSEMINEMLMLKNLAIQRRL
jgi:hypothetical protein